MAAASRTRFGAASRRRARVLLGSPPPLRGRSAQRSCAGRGVSLLVCNLSPSLTLPQSKSDVSDLDRSSIGRTREHPSSVGGGNRPSLPHRARASREHPVQEPGRRRDCAVEPRAEQPEPAAGFILDAEIIAGAAAVLGPPGAFDALRAFGGDDFVERAPP